METTRKIPKMELATIRRTAMNTKAFRKREAQLLELIAKSQEDLVSIRETISLWEKPIIERYGSSPEDLLSNTIKNAEETPKEETSKEDAQTVSSSYSSTSVPTGIFESPVVNPTDQPFGN